MISVIIPAHNEAALIGQCIGAVLASRDVDAVDIIVVANGCQDATVAIAIDCQAAVEARGWQLQVLDLASGGKLGALNAGDAAAKSGNRVYLDADVVMSADLLAQLEQVLEQETAVYASGKLQISPPQNRISRAYRRIYQRVPFMRFGVPGAGLFAVNAAGRARWREWPDIISDDTFARLMFAPDERIGVAATYQWPIVEGLANLVAVRRRQNTGVAEIAQNYPELLKNDDTPKIGFSGVLKLALSDPLGFLTYAGVAVIVKMTKSQGGTDWRRGR
ncbi:MAG: glycosyltransferase [Rhodobacterales bacterium]|nr:glycosyltransferase [Rhodobacterales bacterium]